MPLPPIPEREVLTSREIQAILGCSKKTVARLVKTGQLPVIQTAPGCKFRFPKAAVAALLASKATPLATSPTPAGDQP
jgi:excisionase family DNA binding protein